MNKVFEVRVTPRVRVNLNLRRLRQSRIEHQSKFTKQRNKKSAQINI